MDHALLPDLLARPEPAEAPVTCGVCGGHAHSGAILTVRDLFGRRRRLLACPFCADFIRARQTVGR